MRYWCTNLKSNRVHEGRLSDSLCSENKEFPETHLWWLSTGRCSQSQFKQLCLKWHELYRGNEWGFDLSLALHENSCTWEDLTFDHNQRLHLRLTKSSPGMSWSFIFLWKLPTSYIFLVPFISCFYPLNNNNNKKKPFEIFLFSVPFVPWEMTTKWHKWLTAKN